jgi:hypothetical protein
MTFNRCRSLVKPNAARALSPMTKRQVTLHPSHCAKVLHAYGGIGEPVQHWSEESFLF